MTTEPNNEVPDADARSTDTDLEVAETGTRPDLVWDNEVPGLCVRVHGNGEKSFIFVYRSDNRQRFVRIGTSPRSSSSSLRSRPTWFLVQHHATGRAALTDLSCGRPWTTPVGKETRPAE
jgi:hypothetical protein